MTSTFFSADVKEFLLLLAEYQVRYLIVGGEAVIYHGRSRLTGDVDIFYELEESNIDSLYSALKKFWDNNIPGITDKNELTDFGTIIQFGVPPNRIDLLNEISGVSFQEAWSNKITEDLTINKENVPIYYIGKSELKKNKKAAGRPKDLDDLNYL